MKITTKTLEPTSLGDKISKFLRPRSLPLIHLKWTTIHPIQKFFMTKMVSISDSFVLYPLKIVTPNTRPRSKPMTSNATRPPDFGLFFVDIQMSLRYVIFFKLSSKGLLKNYVVKNLGMKSKRFSSLAESIFSYESSSTKNSSKIQQSIPFG